MADTTENINYKITVDAKSGTAVVRNLKGQIVATKVPVKELTNEFGNLSKTINSTRFNKFNAGLKTASKANENLGDASGAATSSVMELSRVISDAPYGIRGMANNITQLVSQMGFAAKKAGGFGGALNEMGKQLIGPLGIVFLITAAVSAIDLFWGAATKAKKSISDLTKETYANGLVAKQYVKELENVNITEERREVVIQELIKSVPTLRKEDLKYGKNLDKVRLKIKSYVLAQASRIEIEKLVQENSEILSKKNELENINSIDNLILRTDAMRTYLLEKGGWLGTLVEERVEGGDVATITQRFEAILKTVNKEAKPILKRVDELTQSLQLDPSKDKDKPKPKDRVDILGLDSIDIGENKKKMRKVLDAVSDALNIDLKKNPLKIAPELDMELSAEAKAKIASSLKKEVQNLVKDSEHEDLQNFLEKSKEVMGGINDFSASEFKRQLTTEQNKTNALNQELNNRLLNESLSEEKRKSIQNQIAQNDEALRVKQDAIKKKQFKQQKAFNIAMAIISTYSAAAKTLNETPGGSFARIAGMVAVIGSGLAQVAAISRQKFQSSSAQAPINTSSQGGAAGGGERSEPSFNIVGRSNNNQLLNAIQSQFDKPLKAYVVARDVTNQQQLDGVISTSAST